MPLIPRDGGGRHRIEITDEIDPFSAGDWYEIRTMLGYHARLQIETAAVIIQAPANRVDPEFLKSSETIDMRINAADVAHLRLSLWLTGWSHDETISSATIRRIPKAHADAILKVIGEYEKIQGGPRRESPLDSG